MEMVAPAGPVYQAGTLSGNPLAMAAGYAALRYIKDNPGIYPELERKGNLLENGLRENMKKLGKKFALNRIGSMLCMFFTERAVSDFKTAITSDTELYGKYFHGMLERGVYLAPAQFEAVFISTAHSDEDLEKTIIANYETLKSIL